MDEKEKLWFDSWTPNDIEFAKQQTNDPVNHPRHYMIGSMELIDILDAIAEKDYFTPLEWGYVMSILQYIVRAPEKNGLQDYKKAKWYLDRLIKKLEAEDAKES